jgi:hypothetical protein
MARRTDLIEAPSKARAATVIGAILVDFCTIGVDGHSLEHHRATLGEIARGGVAQLIVVSKSAAGGGACLPFSRRCRFCGGDATDCQPGAAIPPAVRCAPLARQLSGLRPVVELVTTSSGRYACLCGNGARMLGGAVLVDSEGSQPAKTRSFDDPAAPR